MPDAQLALVEVAMFHLLFAAKSGWGKSYHCQAYIEQNIGEFDCVLVFDYDGEYRGLVEAGLATHWWGDARTLQGFGPATWRSLVERNQAVIIERALDEADWRQLCTDAVAATRPMDPSILYVIDEAHFVAPKGAALPDPLSGLPTSGRSEYKDSVWVTQRLQKLHETVLSQCTATLLGAFGSGRDRTKAADETDYPKAVLEPGGKPVAGLPEELHAPDGGAISLQKWYQDPASDDTTLAGSEWIWNDDDGTLERINTASLDMESEHHGAAGKAIQRPEYG